MSEWIPSSSLRVWRLLNVQDSWVTSNLFRRSWSLNRRWRTPPSNLPILQLCIVLRDVGTVRSELSVPTAPLFPPGTLSSLSDGCRHLIKWAEQMWSVEWSVDDYGGLQYLIFCGWLIFHFSPGYLPLLQLFDAHIHLVAEAAAIPMQKPKANGHAESRTSRKIGEYS